MLSWHYVKPNAKGVTFYARDKRELEMKKAAMKYTSGRTYVVFDKDKVTEEPPKDAAGYEMDTFMKDHRQDGRPNNLYVITDIVKPIPAQEEVIGVLSSKRYEEAGVKLVYPGAERRVR